MERRSRTLKDVDRVRNTRGALAFSPASERLFRDLAMARNRRWVITGTVVLGALLAVFLGVAYVFIPEGAPPVSRALPMILVMLTVLVSAYVVTKRATSQMLARLGWVAAGMVVMCGWQIIHFLAQGTSERARFTFGLVIAYIIASYSLLHLGRLWSTIAGVLCSSIFVGYAVAGEFYQRQQLAQVTLYLFAANALGFVVSFLIERQDRLFFVLMMQASEATQKTERLLSAVLPQHVAERIKRRETMIAERHERVTVLFARIHGVNRLARSLPPQRLVDLLGEVFGRFDKIAAAEGLTKIKTVGDTYMAAVGLGDSDDEAHLNVADAALAMQRVAFDVGSRVGIDVELSIGLNTGPAVAGVIGRHKLFYDIWGDTVNVASRMESTARPGTAQVSSATQKLLDGAFLLSPGHAVEAKGKGVVTAHVLEGRRLNAKGSVA